MQQKSPTTTPLSPASGGEMSRSSQGYLLLLVAKTYICWHLHLNGIMVHSNLDIANITSVALLEPMQDYSLLVCLPPVLDNSEVLIVSSSEVSKAVLGLNLRKAVGPKGINNWFLLEYAALLTSLVRDILKSSFAEQKPLWSWKDANILHLMKVKSVAIITKNIRPISVKPILSKFEEDFAVRPVVLEVIDPNQFGTISQNA